MITSIETRNSDRLKLTARAHLQEKCYFTRMIFSEIKGKCYQEQSEGFFNVVIPEVFNVAYCAAWQNLLLFKFFPQEINKSRN